MQSGKGFSLIDVIVGIALLLIVFLALLGILRVSLSLSTLVKAKAAAVELANTQMEYLRGLSYDALGTVGGIPTGSIPQTSTAIVDGMSYTIRTFIIYKDDPADGLGAADTNHVTTDYKVGRVTVSYAIYGLTKSVVLLSNFVPTGIESSTGGGTLSLHVVDATGADMSGATVEIVNTAISPAIDLTTFTDTSGLVLIGGAATSTQYQIYVSRTGYSSAQTYARTGTNRNPNPGLLTVAKDQTTSSTFAIDRLATLTVASVAPAVTSSFSDTFANAGNLASMTDTRIDDGKLKLANQALAGSARSLPVNPSYLDGWGLLSATITTPAGTNAVVRVDDAGGTPIPDSVLAGNSIGFSSFPVSLTGLATSSYPGISLEATLTSNSTTTTPSISDWSVSHTSGPAPVMNIPFTLVGTKTIGTTASNTPIYKTSLADTTGATGQKAESLEWDAYVLTLSSGTLLENCPASPYQLPPAVATTTTLLVGTPTANTLPILVKNAAGNAIGHARVVLAKSDYAATVPASACGLAYFNGLAAGTYSATAFARGYATTTVPSIVVSGTMPATTIVLP